MTTPEKATATLKAEIDTFINVTYPAYVVKVVETATERLKALNELLGAFAGEAPPSDKEKETSEPKWEECIHCGRPIFWGLTRWAHVPFSRGGGEDKISWVTCKPSAAGSSTAHPRAPVES